jgi:hypothetical protein
MHVSASGNAKRLVDLAAYEASVNPDGAQIDSNPYGMLALPGHRLVTDAGGNSLLDVAANGSISNVATFPKIPGGPLGSRDGVPTDVVVGPDGAYYVSTLTGFPFTTGTASVYRVVPGQAPTPYATGLTQLTDLAFGPDGSLYTLQHAEAFPGGGTGGREEGVAGRRFARRSPQRHVTTKTSAAAFRTSLVSSAPRARWRLSLRPMTISSAFRFSAASRISVAGSPTASMSSGSMPRWTRRSFASRKVRAC